MSSANPNGQGSKIATVAGATALLGLRGVHAAGDDTIRVALVGCGGRGTGAVGDALRTKGPVKLWAMADAFEDRLTSSLEALAQASGGPTGEKTLASRIDVPPERRFVGLDAFRRAIDCDVHLVILAGSPGFRPQHFEYAVEKGRNVFMEKPVATDAPGIRRVLAASKLADSKGLKVGVGLQRHHEKAYLEILPRLRDGAIGDIVLLSCAWNGGTVKIPRPRGDLSELEHQVRNWYFFHWLSGDHNVEQHVHNLDVCNWIKGAAPVRAQGQGGREVRKGNEWGDIFDHHYVEYTYADGTTMFSQCRQIVGCTPNVGELAVGTRGSADVGKAILRAAGQPEWRYPKPRNPRAAGPLNPYQVEHDDLFAAIRANTPYNEAARGAEATMTAILGRMATYSGQVVEWEAALERGPRLTIDAATWNDAPPTLARADGSYAVAVPGVTKPWPGKA